MSLINNSYGFFSFQEILTNAPSGNATSFLSQSQPQLLARFVNLDKLKWNWQDGINPNINDHGRQLLRNKASLITKNQTRGFRLPKVDEDVFLPLRKMEYTYLERMTLACFVLFLVLIIGLKSFWPWSVMSFPAQDTVRYRKYIFIFGLLPLIIYQFYKLLPFSSSSVHMSEGLLTFIIELFLLALFMVLIPTFIISKKHEVGKTDFSLRTNSCVIVSLSSLMLLSLIFYFLKFQDIHLDSLTRIFLNDEFFSPIRSLHSYEVEMNTLQIVAIMLITCSASVLVSKTIVGVHRSKSIGRVLPEVFRYLSMTILTLSVYSSLYLTYIEDVYLSQDTIIGVDSPILNIEVEHVEELKSKLGLK
ncbi:MAG: hypothetical protein NE334_20300 [Lentisphaeraceae bacterium]|nr:hypothetical protein [Lentisphaeraceae bacterium]